MTVFTCWEYALEDAEFCAKTYKVRQAIVANGQYFGVMPVDLVQDQLIYEVVNAPAESLCCENNGDEDAARKDPGA